MTTPLQAANALLDSITTALKVQNPTARPEGEAGIALAELLRAADRPDRDPWQDLQAVVRVAGMQLAKLPPQARPEAAKMLKAHIDAGASWQTPPGGKGSVNQPSAAA
jgi:hypothetical protein